VANGAALALIAIVAVVAAPGTPAGRWWVLGAASLAAVFAWAAVSKVAGVRAWRRTLSALELPPTVVRVAVRAVPAAEAVVPALVVAGLPRVAAVWSAGLLVAFSGGMVATRRVGARIPCGCFGVGGTVRIGTALARNAALAMLAIVVLVQGADQMRIPWPGSLGGGDALPAMLGAGSLVAAALAAWRASVWLERGRRA
jgi:hypothetical protein